MSLNPPTLWYIPSHAASTGLHVVQHFGVRQSLLLSGISELILGTGLRSNIIKLHFQDKTSPQERAYVSALSGGISGGLVTRLMGTTPLSQKPNSLAGMLTLFNRRSIDTWSCCVLIAWLRWPECFQPIRHMADGKGAEPIQTACTAYGRFKMDPSSTSF